jgi:glutamate formiminotransferase/formiminotetrahydrofolate cyclodeaminase
VLTSAKGLKAFCDELASAEPSPGGGTAAAAAGAMAASLLSMVCGITLKNKKHESNWSKLAMLKEESDALSSLLLRLAADDALAYDRVVETTRAKRAAPADGKAAAAYADAVRVAMEVPMSTAEACVKVLRLSEKVSSIGTKSASSDIEVARRLAGAGVDGAVANVLINLPYCEDASFASTAKSKAEELRRERRQSLAP